MTQTTTEQRQGDIIDTECRLRAWIRDFGHEKQPAFIRDLTDVLDSLSRLRTALAEAERDAARYRLIAKVVRPRREREPDPGWMDWIFSTVRADTFEAAIDHPATKELAEMQHRMRTAILEEMRNPTEPSKGET